MKGLSKLMMELGSTGMFSSVEFIDHEAISKDHLRDIKATFNNQEIIVQVFTGDDYESIAKKIIEKAKFDQILLFIEMGEKQFVFSNKVKAQKWFLN